MREDSSIDYAYIVRPHLTYDWNGNFDMLQSVGHLSDYEVAATVRMLSRSSIAHEAVVTNARDRIMALSKEVHRLEKYVEKLEADAIVSPAECSSRCDDPHCPYSHQPLTLRQAYENAVSRCKSAEEELSAYRKTAFSATSPETPKDDTHAQP